MNEKLTSENVINFIKENKKYLSDKCKLIKIGLLGSFAREEQTGESDIDLIIEFKGSRKK